MKEKTVSIIDIINYIRPLIKTIYGETAGLFIDNIPVLGNENLNSLNWIKASNSTPQKIAESSQSRVLIVGENVEYSDVLKKQGKVLIVVENPRLCVARVIKQFFIEEPESIIHKSSYIDPKAIIGENVFIGANSSIGNCVIGDNVQIHSNVTLYDNVIVHNNVTIHSGSVLGVDGLGCERLSDGTLEKFPHIGRLIIEEKVDIGANCQIAKGTLSDTIIGCGCKINAGCNIAHNVLIGKNVWISPHVIIGGSAKINDNATLFIGCMIRDNRTIGINSIIGIGSVVTKNVPAGETWVGNPACKLR